MAKSHSQFVCQQCGAIYTSWNGRCSKCGAWNSLVEQIPEDARDEKSAVSRGQASGKLLKYASINDLEVSNEKERLRTGFPDLDTVLLPGHELR